MTQTVEINAVNPEPPFQPVCGLPGVILGTAMVCVLIACMLWSVAPPTQDYSFINILVHSEAIGLIVCTSTVLIRQVFANVTGPLRWLMLPCFVVLSFVGFVAGTLLARWITGLPVWPLDILGDTDAGVSLFTTSVVTVILSWFFISREQLASLKLAAAREGERAEAAKLAMLRAQVEPHMLFNTLANLRALIVVDPERAIEMLDRFNDFLRRTLDSSRDLWTSIEDEFRVLENYLELMKIRLGPRLQYTMQLPDDLKAEQLPSLLLQPIIENAIRHGIEPSIDGGSIDISARREGNQIIFEIIDTGIGFDMGKPVNSDGGFGLFSLRERLAGMGVEGESLIVESPAPGDLQGTRVVVRIPA